MHFQSNRDKRNVQYKKVVKEHETPTCLMTSPCITCACPLITKESSRTVSPERMNVSPVKKMTAVCSASISPKKQSKDNKKSHSHGRKYTHMQSGTLTDPLQHTGEIVVQNLITKVP